MFDNVPLHSEYITFVSIFKVFDFESWFLDCLSSMKLDHDMNVLVTLNFNCASSWYYKWISVL